MKAKSTYSLLLEAESQDKGRSIFETAVYTLVILCAAVSAWTFVSGDVTLPGEAAVKQEAPATMIANAPALNTVRG